MAIFSRARELVARKNTSRIVLNTSQPKRTVLLLALVLALALVVSGVLASPDGYLHKPGHLPYRFTDLIPYSQVSSWFSGWLQLGLPIDVDGDGSAEILTISDTGPYLITNREHGSQELWQEPLPVKYSGPDCLYGIEGVWTFSEAVGPEAVFKVSSPDRFTWLIQRRLVGDGSLQYGFEFRGGSDVRADGLWDGQIKVLGVETVVVAGKPRQAMIILANAGHDLQKRGVFAVDAQDGHAMWSYPIGPKPELNISKLVDLDADGRREILVQGNAVGNIHDVYFNGTRDDTARVMVINPDGHLLWSWNCAAYPGGCCVTPVDPDQGGRRNVLVGNRNPLVTGNTVWLLDPWGHQLAELDVGSGVRWLEPVPGPGPVMRVAMGQTDGTVSMLVVTENSIRKAEQVKLTAGIRLGGVLDCLPASGLELVVQERDHKTWVLSEQLQPLAVLTDESFPLTTRGIEKLNLSAGKTQLLYQGNMRSPGKTFSLVSNPRPIPWRWIFGLLIVGGLVPMAVRNRRRPSAETRRELRLQLLERLQLSGHGAIGGLSSLRRLVWNMKALAQGFTMSGDQKLLMGDFAADILENQLPKLAGAVELAQLVELDSEKTGRAAKALADLGNRLDHLVQQGDWQHVPVVEVANLGKAGEVAEDAFQDLRAEVEEEFRVQPEQVIRQCLAAHAAAMEAANMAVDVELSGLPDCCMDAEELVFVVDNLVENAVRAMAGARDARLRISWKSGGNFVTIHVTDTGCGIIPEDWQRIFEAGQSTRKGGGLGLPRSREILRKFGGGLMVKESSLGGGTVMALTLVVATTDS